jgi:sialidase-1
MKRCVFWKVCGAVLLCAVVIAARAATPGAVTAKPAGGPEGSKPAQDASSTPVVLWKGARIPSIDITPKGTLLAFAQHGGGDNHPNVIEVRRSTDGGKTWSKAKPLMADKSGRANPSPLVDHKTGTVWLFWSDRTKGVYRLKYSVSNDDGLTWSEGKPLQIDKDADIQGLPSCTRGIQLSTGRLLMPFNIYFKRPRRGRTVCPKTIYSDDHGKTWTFATGHAECYGSSEYTLLELADGQVYMNHRVNTNRHLAPGFRVVAFSEDGGLTWGKPQRGGLPTPSGNGCHSGLARLTHPETDDKSRVLFSYPAGTPGQPVSRYGRQNLTIKISYDECKSWTPLKAIYEGRVAYSNLIVLPDKSIGCIYEGRSGIAFKRFTLEWLTDGKDKVVPKETPVETPDRK